MRNLGLRSSACVSFRAARISAVALDLDENAIYAVSDRPNAAADVQVEIYKVDSQIKDLTEAPIPTLVALFTSSLLPNYSPQGSEVVSFRILPDTRSLCVILRVGDIVTIPLDHEDPVARQADVVGSVDFGILASSWSPDDSLLALITGDNKLMLMTSTFDVLSEATLHTTDFGEDAPINVGWGSKQTQFHGSLGKSAAQAPSTSLDQFGSSPDDDQAPRISWRGDGSFFAVSSLPPETTNSPRRRRTLRVYDREGALQSTSEPVAGLEHTLSWRPSGNLIASTQRFGFEGGGAGKEGRHDVVFFERNGLRHGEFGLRVVGTKIADQNWGYKVKEVNWSSDSNVLAIWIENQDKDVVQLWTTSNYHWYLKQEISSSDAQRFTSVTWHPENGLQLFITTETQLIVREFDWEIWASSSLPPNDSGSVAVLDGTNVLLTPFRSQNVPPPMSSYQLSLSGSSHATLVHASFSDEKDVLALLWVTGAIQVWDLNTRLAPGPEKIMNPVKLWDDNVEAKSPIAFRRVNVSSISDGSVTVGVLGSATTGSDILIIVEVGQGKVKSTKEIRLPGRNGNLVSGSICWQDLTGQIHTVDVSQGIVARTAKLSEYCPLSQKLYPYGDFPPCFVGLTQSGKLHVSNSPRTSHVLATNANSFTAASGYLVYTNLAHEAHFVSVDTLNKIDPGDPNLIIESEKRRVERGSRIVTVIPSNMTLVLQMPRGNLESINPRPLVLQVVRQDIDAGDYRKAFLACRKHRIDLDVLVQHNPDAFFDRLSTFLEQIDEVDYINLFLTSIGRGTQEADIICRVCDSVRLELEKKDLRKYTNSILTAYVVKTPADHEAGLSLLLRLRETVPSLVEDAVKYIIFLVDADSLFDLALGMYDFSLVLMIAQHAQKDPREYLPFLRELRALEKYYQRFRIDDHLQRREKALWNLSLAGPERFDDAMEYVEKYRLHETALSIWKNTENYDSVLNLYGDWLFERREFSQAALVFVEAEKPPKALIAFEKALEWQELFDLATRDEMDEEDLAAMGIRVAEELSSKRRHAEAARVFLDYAGDVRQAVIAFSEGNLFAEARRTATLHAVPELLTEVIHPAALESKSHISDEIDEMRSQLRKQVQRIRELRIRKVEEPDAFYGTEDVDLHNIDVMTDVSMAPTAFTRYTVAPSTASSKKSRQTSRSRRKAERKIGSGKKGTVDEEEYLLHSFAKLVTRLASSQTEAGKLLPHMLQFTDEHREEGKSLQTELIEFQDELKLALDEVWTKAEKLGDDENPTTKVQDLIEKIPKPEFAEPKWRVKLWEVKESRSLLES